MSWASIPLVNLPDPPEQKRTRPHDRVTYTKLRADGRIQEVTSDDGMIVPGTTHERKSVFALIAEQAKRMDQGAAYKSLPQEDAESSEHTRESENLSQEVLTAFTPIEDLLNTSDQSSHSESEGDESAEDHSERINQTCTELSQHARSLAGAGHDGTVSIAISSALFTQTVLNMRTKGDHVEIVFQCHDDKDAQWLNKNADGLRQQIEQQLGRSISMNIEQQPAV